MRLIKEFNCSLFLSRWLQICFS